MAYSLRVRTIRKCQAEVIFSVPFLLLMGVVMSWVCFQQDPQNGYNYHQNLCCGMFALMVWPLLHSQTSDSFGYQQEIYTRLEPFIFCCEGRSVFTKPSAPLRIYKQLAIAKGENSWGYPFSRIYGQLKVAGEEGNSQAYVTASVIFTAGAMRNNDIVTVLLMKNLNQRHRG